MVGCSVHSPFGDMKGLICVRTYDLGGISLSFWCRGGVAQCRESLLELLSEHTAKIRMGDQPSKWRIYWSKSICSLRYSIAFFHSSIRGLDGFRCQDHQLDRPPSVGGFCPKTFLVGNEAIWGQTLEGHHIGNTVIKGNKAIL